MAFVLWVVFPVGMLAAQTRLFPDPHPLVDRLGRGFFRQVPEAPGVYLMRDDSETVLYVGKARNLRKRLGSYRVANPDRLPRRLLRLLHRVARIDLETCPDELAALQREGELLRSLQPKFNRAGVWPPPPRFLAWRVSGNALELGLMESAEDGWQTHGPLKGGAIHVRNSLVRLLWCVLQPQRGLLGMPSGWVHGRLPDQVAICAGEGCLDMPAKVEAHLQALVIGNSESFLERLKCLVADEQSWQRTLFEEDMDAVRNFFSKCRSS